MTTEMEKVCKSSSSKYAKIAGLHFQQSCSSVPVWCQLVRVKLSSARLSRLNPFTEFQLYEFDLKGFVLHVYIMTFHSCLHWLYIMWAFLFQRLATLIKSLSTADQAKNKFMKNRLLKDLTYTPFLLCDAAILYMLLWESWFQTMGYFQTISFDCSSLTSQSKRLVKNGICFQSALFAVSASK